MTQFSILDRVVHPSYRNILTVVGEVRNGRVALSDGTAPPFIAKIKDLTYVGKSEPREKSTLLRMYVVVDNACFKGLAANGASHVSYMAGGSFGDTELQKEWSETSFRNVTCSASSEEIQTAIREADKAGIRSIQFFEPDWLEAGDRPLAVAFEARYWFPEIFKTFPFFLKGL